MNLVKWLRKNNVKIMAVVIIVLMIGFIGGSSLQQIFMRRQSGRNKAAAYYLENKKITTYDIALAQRELEILREMGADVMLMSANLQLLRVKDLQLFLLGQLLFSDQRTSPGLITSVKQMIKNNGYKISDKQINDIYRTPFPKSIYWLMLKNEARQAGVRISNDRARQQLVAIIPRITPDSTYAKRLASTAQRFSVSEKDILAIFGNLLAVLEYARVICLNEAVTGSQVMHNISRDEEVIDVELVKFDSDVFAKTQKEPSEQEILAHFEKYKGFLPGTISDENPYGFGYKLADRVRLEYIALKLDDISRTVTPPTQEQVEQYYQKYKGQFIEQLPSDPNDPNSPPIQRIKSYAEVAGAISESLLLKEINSKAENILQEAITLTELSLEDVELADITSEQLKQMAGDYSVAAYKLTEKYKIKLYTGKTGFLSSSDIQADEYLGRLFMLSNDLNPVWLPWIAFAVDELSASELGPFDVPKPILYKNIGPLKDITTLTSKTGQIMAIARVIEAKKAVVPESINLTFSKKTLDFEQDEKPESQDIYSIEEKVIQDLKKLAALDTTKNKTEDFIKQVVKDGWDGAIEKFNQLYKLPENQDQPEPNAFALQNLTDLRRASKDVLETLAVLDEGDPSVETLNNLRKKQSLFINQLYSLVPPDSNSLETVPFIMEFKPDMSYYCLKNLSVRRLLRQDYETIKATRFYREDIIQSQAQAPVYSNPENILKRMNFRPIVQKKSPSDANAPVQTQGGS